MSNTNIDPAIASTRRVRLAIESVIVGERHRRDLGDLDALAANIKDTGLLRPIVVRRDGTLIAGERRLRAAAP
jgi:ParB family chromosome partitioning protein